MARFRDLIRRMRKRPAKETRTISCTFKASQHVEYASTPNKYAEIASISTADMQTSTQGTYINSDSSITQHEKSPKLLSSGTSIYSDPKTAVEVNQAPSNVQSVWKGAANGRQYDKREELTPEDEDMWAKMCM